MEHDLSKMNLLPVSAEILKAKEQAIDHNDFTPFTTANQLISADFIIVAAPYWDLSFPAVLKIWVENVWVRNLTFSYQNDICHGHLNATNAIYITTAGDKVGDKTDWGYGYIKAVFKALGVGRGEMCKDGMAQELKLICADGLDLANADVNGILSQAREELDKIVTDVDWNGD